MEARDVDIAGLNLNDKVEEAIVEEPPKVTIAREKVLEEAKKELEAKEKQGKKAVSLVVIGKHFKVMLIFTTYNTMY
jgi:elongation factor 1 alpha-like protein